MRSRNERAAEKRIKQLYVSAARQVKMDLWELYDKVQNKSDSVIPNDFYKCQKYFQLLNNLNDNIRALGGAEEKVMESQLLDMYADSQKAVQSGYAFTVGYKTSAERVIDQVWTPDGIHYSNRIWRDKSKLTDRLTSGLNECISRGLPFDKVADELIKEFNVSRNAADRLVRTELAHVQNEAAADTYKAAGVEKYKVLSNQADDDCLDLDDEEFSFDDAQIGVNFPPFHPNCRCTIAPVINI